MKSRLPGPPGWAVPILSAVFVIAYSLLVLLRDAVQADAVLRWSLTVTAAGCWVALVLGFVVALARAGRGRRLAFAAGHRRALAAAVFPLFGVFAILDYLATIPGLRGNGGNALRSRVALQAAAYAAALVYVIALAVLTVERDSPGASIRTFGEAIWWSSVTVATVGYGDYTPVTPLGRALAIVLMAGGLVIIGTASALIVSYLTERIRARIPHD